MDALLTAIALFWPVFIIGSGVLVIEVIDRKGRFGLRTLLIATTLVAVVLGIIAVSS